MQDEMIPSAPSLTEVENIIKNKEKPSQEVLAALAALTSGGRSVDKDSLTKFLDAAIAYRLDSAGNKEIAEKLIFLGAPVNLEMLKKATNGSKPETLAALLEGNKAANARNEGVDLKKEGGELLVSALRANWPTSYDVMKQLLEHGAPADTKGPHNRNLYQHLLSAHSISTENKVAGIHLLHSHKADPNVPDQGGNYAMHDAANSNIDIVQALSAIGAKVIVSNKEGETPLHRMARGGTEEAVFDLVLSKVKTREEHEAFINARTKDGKTATLLAAESNYHETLGLLMRAGANPNIPDNSGNLPLFAIIERENVKGVQALLAGGADWRQKNQSGENALQVVERMIARQTQRMIDVQKQWEKDEAERPPELTGEDELAVAALRKKSFQDSLKHMSDRMGDMRSMRHVLQGYENRKLEQEKALSPKGPPQQSAVDPMQDALEKYRSGYTPAAPAAEPQLMALEAPAAPAATRDTPQTGRT